MLIALLAAANAAPAAPAAPGPADVGASVRRAPIAVAPLAVPDAPAAHVAVKFEDGLRARAAGDRVALPAPSPALDALIARWDLRFTPLVDVEDAALDRLEARARARVGTVADLRGLLAVEVPDADADALVAVAAALRDVPGVQYAYVRGVGWAPPGDISPTTPDWSDRADWLGPDPGIDALAAHALGVRGAGVVLADCEYGWNLEHEDLVESSLDLENGVRIPSWVEEYTYDQHGTAAVGVVVAGDNGYGALGAAPDTPVTLWPEYSTQGERRVTSIANAVAAAAPGDVVMLEMQAIGRPGGDYGPAELDPAVYEVVRAATDAGVIVVAAAGNGAQDLDDGWYTENYLAWGDSGAILVGAGSANRDHDTLWFSTYGSRVNLQGWGEGVFTTGYGDVELLGGDIDQAYTLFSGTSSATPIVASAVVLVQDYRLQKGLAPLDAWGMRELLVETGVPRGDGGEIGPLPDVAAAIAWHDGDGDGHVAEARGGDDCDDTDDAVNPGRDPADERPGRDLNCDGETPEPEESPAVACACGTTAPAATPWLLLATAGLLARRRRP